MEGGILDKEKMMKVGKLFESYLRGCCNVLGKKS